MQNSEEAEAVLKESDTVGSPDLSVVQSRMEKLKVTRTCSCFCYCCFLSVCFTRKTCGIRVICSYYSFVLLSLRCLLIYLKAKHV